MQKLIMENKKLKEENKGLEEDKEKAKQKEKEEGEWVKQIHQECETMRCELETMEKQKQERKKVYKQKAHSLYKKIEKYNAELEIKQENVPKEDKINYDEEEFEDEEVEDEEEFEDEKEVTDDGEDEKKPVASGQSTEDTHQWIVKTLQKKAPGAVYNTVVDEESATKHNTSDGIIIMNDHYESLELHMVEVQLFQGREKRTKN